MSSSSPQSVEEAQFNELESRKRTTMTSLAPELLQQIFGMVKDEGADDTMPEGKVFVRFDGVEADLHIDPHSISPYLIAPNEEHPSYKAFRQVNSLWYSIATPLVFQTVILDRNIDSWRRLEAICTTPQLAQHVKIIQVVTVEALPWFSDTEMHNFDNMMGYGQYLPNGGPYAQLSSNRESIRDRYRRWRDDEKVLNDHRNTDTAPQLHLNLLPSFNRVETIGHRELAVIKRKYDVTSPRGNFGRWRHYSLATRREIETSLWDDGRPIFGGDHFPLILFFRALHDSGKTVHSLAIRNAVEIALDTPGRPPSIESIRRLEIHLPPSKYPFLYGSASWVDNQNVWLSELTNLEELFVFMDPKGPEEIGFFDLLSPMRFPRLGRLHLKHVGMSYDTLNPFLQAHEKTIQSLHIEEPHISVDEWRKFCAQEKVEVWEAKRKHLYLTEAFVLPR